MRLACTDSALQHTITHGMAVSVVDGLEMIQVDQHQAGIARSPAAMLQLQLGLVEKMLPVEDVRKPVTTRQPHETQLGKLYPVSP